MYRCYKSTKVSRYLGVEVYLIKKVNASEPHAIRKIKFKMQIGKDEWSGEKAEQEERRLRGSVKRLQGLRRKEWKDRRWRTREARMGVEPRKPDSLVSFEDVFSALTILTCRRS